MLRTIKVFYEFLKQYKFDYLKIVNKIRGLGTASPSCRQAHKQAISVGVDSTGSPTAAASKLACRTTPA
jgi:hypothetical protein